MPQDQVEEVKAKIDIVSLISEYIDVKKAGRNYKALCPFHNEKTPSFMISPELQIFKCFGCGESGDVFSFLQKHEGMDFPEALRFLAERAGVKLVFISSGPKGEKERLYEINSLAAKFYNYILLNHESGREALRYLTKDRGIKLSTIKTFRLGFCPNTPFALKKFMIDKKGFRVDDLVRAGILYRYSGRVYDRFRGRIVFPLFDHRGNTVGFAGRILPSSAKKDLAKYINSPETAVYHKSRTLYGLNLTRSDIKKKGKVIVVEGELDMISSWQAGVKNVVAIKGTALTEDQVRLLARFAKTFILALDSDLAGDKAARRSVVLAQDQGVEVRVARLKGYKDPDEAARKSPVEYKKILKEAVGVWDFVIESIFSSHNVKTGAGKAKISKEVAAVLASINDKIVQAHYTKVVADKLGVPPEAVAEEVAKASGIIKTAAPVKIETPAYPRKKTRRELLEERLLTLAFQSDAKILTDKKIATLIKTPLTARIIDEYRNFLKAKGKFDPSEFAESLPKELVDGFAEMILTDLEGLEEKPDALKKELGLVIRELQLLWLKEALADLGKEIRIFEKEGKKQDLKKAEEKFKKLSQEFSELEGDETKGIIL